MAHKFCPKCGTSVMARMHEAKNGQAIAVNIRALSDVDPLSLAVLTSDGAAIEPFPAEEGTHVYEGSCHCGAVTYTLRQTDEPISLLTMCNCSICSRDAALWIYPTTSSLTFDGLDSLKEYTFATNKTFHGFCEICGVAIRERFEASPTTAINARTIHGLDLASSALEHFDGKSMLPLYEV
ncbi:Mss4-like protein [Mycena sp. CBHHK59/15]|nr:Mss4-like protein [Mycena sp. CBHHK59/15]